MNWESSTSITNLYQLLEELLERASLLITGSERQIGGFQLVYGSTANLFIDRHDEYIGYGPEAMELVGLPDPDTFCQLPWDKRVARVFCVCFRNREERENAGAFLTSDCRGNLKRAHKIFKEQFGLEFRVGTEPEMMWLKKGQMENLMVG